MSKHQTYIAIAITATFINVVVFFGYFGNDPADAALQNNYNKSSGDPLSATEWKSLVDDFLPTENPSGNIRQTYNPSGAAAGLKLRINGGTDSGELQLRTNVNAANHWALYSHNATGDFNIWYGNGTTGVGLNHLTVDTGGNVGIGTANPSAKLDVTMNGNWNDYDAPNDQPNSFLPSGKEPNIIVNANITAPFVVGPVQPTYIGGIGFAQNGVVGAGIYANNPNPEGSPLYRDIRFWTTRWDADLDNYRTGDRMIITRDGNVGIGTTNPNEKLEVAGNIEASGSICGASGCVGGSVAPIGPKFISPVNVKYVAFGSNCAATTTFFNATPYIPATATAVILESEVSQSGTDGMEDWRNSYIWISTNSSFPATARYILTKGRAASTGDRISWGNQGVFPVAGGGFYFRIGGDEFDEGCTIRLIGYY